MYYLKVKGSVRSQKGSQKTGNPVNMKTPLKQQIKVFNVIYSIVHVKQLFRLPCCFGMILVTSCHSSFCLQAKIPSGVTLLVATELLLVGTRALQTLRQCYCLALLCCWCKTFIQLPCCDEKLVSQCCSLLACRLAELWNVFL